jgi:two-component system, OmpR family, KDP operon response regulator KdpE
LIDDAIHPRESRPLLVSLDAPRSMDGSLQPLVLVIDGELTLHRGIDSTVALHGCRCVRAAPRAQAVLRAIRLAPDLVIVDTTGARLDWVRMTRQLRRWTRVPLLLLVAGCTKPEKRALLEAGADDYIAATSRSADVLSRLRKWLRHLVRAERHTIEQEGKKLRISTDRRSLYVRGRQVHITPLEYRLLIALRAAPRGVLSAERLTHAVWGRSSVANARRLRALLRRLRFKIEADPDHPTCLLSELGGYSIAMGTSGIKDPREPRAWASSAVAPRRREARTGRTLRR